MAATQVIADAPRTELWCANLAAAGPALHDLDNRHRLLSAGERERAAALRDSEARDEWLAAHIALRVIIGRFAGRDAARLAFAVAEHGKPYLPQVALTFSLSHAPGVALIGLTTERTIGVDIERYRTVRIGAARRAGIEAVAAHLSSAPLPTVGEDAGARFLQAWVRIEALAKADGCGVGRMLTRLGVRGRAAAGGPARDAVSEAQMSAARARAALAGENGGADGITQDRGARGLETAGPVHTHVHRPTALTISDLALGEGLCAAVAVAGGSGTKDAIACRALPTQLVGLEKLFA